MTARQAWWNGVLYNKNQLDSTAEWIDRITQYTARVTGALLWDSSLPDNLANGRECRILKKGHQQDTPGYGQEVLHCNDTFHPSASTMRTELDMIFNLVCNGNLLQDEGEDLCC
ncbi:uncharacterized protein LOC122251868 [Penaeus japonicus]|uniref:uncharacterized protein LOC122251868 n=1 Tax=Penaeus japonicus TaxID=27405 RepID=UPI001C70D593|nr:uncharacterized protein LOC122251868 [Penaeus japonicus]